MAFRQRSPRETGTASGRSFPGGLMRSAMQRWWLGIVIAGLLIAVLAQPKAQPAPVNEDALVLEADQALGDAVRGGDKSVARRLISLQFTFVDENGKVHERKEFLSGLTGMAAAPAADAKIKSYGRVATVTGHRKSAHDTEVFFLDIWVRQKGAWRALASQDVVLAATDAPRAAPALSSAGAAPYDCKNPCQSIP